LVFFLGENKLRLIKAVSKEDWRRSVYAA